MGCRRGGVATSLGICQTGAPAIAGSQEQEVAAPGDGLFRPRAAGEGRTPTFARSGQDDPYSPGEFGPDRTAADTAGSGRVSGGQKPGRLRQTRGSAARLAP